MAEKIMKGLSLGFAVLLIAGCTGSAGVRVRSYSTDKQRVDQKMEGGNFGYVQGTPAPEDRSNLKKTRRIYVLEFTKDAEETEEEIPVEQTTPPSSAEPTAASQRPLPEWAKPVNIPSFDEESAAQPKPAGEAAFIEYTVQKEDTLQKISKKFYDSYSKWPKIYESNKDVIPNPDRIKPGITLRVPVE